MANFVKLTPDEAAFLREQDPFLVSYNVEMTEITGGTFWKAYTPEQVAGNGNFPFVGFFKASGLMQEYPPIDLYNPRLRKLAKEIGPAWVRVSGTWSTKTYYDFDGRSNGVPPEGFQSVLTKEQWIGVLDFVKFIHGKLLVSVSNCAGIHDAHAPWNPSQAKQLFDFSRDYGVPIAAAEFMNEPNLLSGSGAPKGYTISDFVRDQDIFNKWLHDNYPGTLAVGPCSIVGGKMGKINLEKGLFNWLTRRINTESLIKNAKEKMDVFSYHYYNGVSERITAGLHFVHWPAHQAHTEAYLDNAGFCAQAAAKLRDQYMPGAPLWVTEAGDAGGGGDTWASTYLDVLRTLNELGSFSAVSQGVIFHNTLASSDYGWLRHGSFEPRPNYFAILLWQRLMGTAVHNSGIPIREGAHVYVHSYKADPSRKCCLIINNSAVATTTVDVPSDALCWLLSGLDGDRRAPIMTLNGRPLTLNSDDSLPDLSGMSIPAGPLSLPPLSCTFLVL